MVSVEIERFLNSFYRQASKQSTISKIFAKKCTSYKPHFKDNLKTPNLTCKTSIAAPTVEKRKTLLYLLGHMAV